MDFEDIAPKDWKALQDALGSAFGEIEGRVKGLQDEFIELHQKHYGGSFSGSSMGSTGDASELAELLIKSGGLEAFQKGNTPKFALEVPVRLLSARKTLVKSLINADGQNQPLVDSDRASSRGLVFAPEQRLTIRGLFESVPTSSNLIERPTESTYTNNADIQGNDSSPTGTGEGASKAESTMSFTLTSTAVRTIAHWISASRQILSDAPLLARHLDSRLIYGLNIKEEAQFLKGDGTGLNMSGINTQATAFTGGSTNQTRLDTLAKAANQLAVSNYEPSGFVLHPSDWLDCQLEKDTTGKYILGDPGRSGPAMAWGLPVVPTPSQTQGKFTVVDAARYGYIADREDSQVRVSEHTGENFIRNLVTLLAEKRCVLVCELAGAAIYGDLTFAG